jgi:low affinity Fe/Cu permease
MGSHSWFDRVAERCARFSSSAIFFSACVLLVVVWAPSYFLFGSIDTWQLVINTATTIVTFLLVALLQNSQRRFEQAVQLKLDAIADGLADLMLHLDGDGGLKRDVDELKERVGLETDPG